MLWADGELEPERAAQVEAYLAESPSARRMLGSLEALGEAVREAAQAGAERAGADGLASRVMDRIDRDVAEVRPLDPARDAGRRRSRAMGYAACGLALAAGVLAVIWRLSGPLARPLANAPSAAVRVAASVPDMAAATAAAGRSEGDAEPGVSVDAIEFGAQAGAIFYVPGDTGTTTVVWLSEDEAEEAQR
jgi:hypothetical protein